MSPRAAWRLEQLGFTRVHDYVPGKSAWLAADLPYEGEAVLAALAVDRDVPTCRVGERIGEVRARLSGDAGPCVARNDAGIVMGVVTPESLGNDRDASVDSVMRFGVTTVRPSEDLEGLLHRMGHAEVDAVVVTRADATLVGILTREQGEEVLAARS